MALSQAPLTLGRLRQTHSKANSIKFISPFQMSRKFSRAESRSDLSDFLDRGHAANRENRWTFEVAWEAANKVGGIYTVIRSKAFVSTEELGEFYCLMGPYVERCARAEVEECDFPTDNPLNWAVAHMRQKGYKVCSG